MIFDQNQISFIKQLITDRNKEIRHEVSDHTDRALPVIKLEPGTSGYVVGTDGDSAAWVPSWSSICDQILEQPSKLADGMSIVGASIGATTWTFCTSDSLASSGSANAPILLTNLGSPTVPTGYKRQVVLVGRVHTNATAPGVNFTWALAPFTATGGGAGVHTWTIGSDVASCTISAPSSSTAAGGDSGWVDWAYGANTPAAVTLATSGTTAANSRTGVHFEIWTRIIPA